MPGTCVIGLQWGDEAKGKLVDILTGEHDIVVRYAGGANAGHTVVSGGQTFECEVVNVSTGGALLVPALPLIAGATFTLTHPSSTISLTGRVIAQADDGTRIEFDQPTAGAIVSAWMRSS